jgi:hypothetical protein
VHLLQDLNPLRYTDPTGLYCFYADPNNGNDNMDASQFDFHSSQSDVRNLTRMETQFNGSTMAQHTTLLMAMSTTMDADN